MATEPDAGQAQLQGLFADCRERHLADFRLRYSEWLSGGIHVSQLCLHAGHAFDACASQTLAMLVNAGVLSAVTQSVWLLQQYQDGLVLLGSALREEIAEPKVQHAVAQSLQERLLRAEKTLRDALQARSGLGGSSSGIDAGAGPHTVDPSAAPPGTT